MTSPISPTAQDARDMSDRTESTPKSEIAPGPDAEPEYLDGLKLHLLVFALILVILIMTLDTSIVSTATPRITDTFHTITDIGWYGAAFLFTNATLQPMSGKFYTFFPMKICFISFLAVFELGSLLCATSISSAMFIIGRAVAGIGSSGLVNGALTIIGSAGAPEKKPMLMGLIMAVAGAGQILGPLIGGALTERTTWRWCFYINLPCGALVAVFLTFIKFPTNLPRRKQGSILKDFDLIGFAIFTPALIMLMMALQWGGTQYSWSSPLIITFLAISGVLLIILCIWEHRAGSNAMFPPTLLRLRVFTSACATGFFGGGTTLILVYYLPLWFQTVHSATPISSAVHTLPFFITVALTAVVTGFLCPRVIPYLTPFGITGSMLASLGAGLMSTFTPSSTTGIWIAFEIISGVGRAFVMQNPVQIVQLHISRADLPVGTAIVSWAQFFGGSLMLALAQTLFGNLLRSALGRYAPGVDTGLITTTGATNLLRVIPGEDVAGVKLAYNDAITKTLVLAAASSAAGTVCAFGMGWKKVPKKKKNDAKGSKEEVKEKMEEEVAKHADA